MIRPLDQLEKAFFNPIAQNDIFFSMKFTEKKYVEKATENFIKLFSGLRLKVVNDSYFKREMNAVHKLPNWIQDCKMASKWAEENIFTPISEGLANIAANDRILVIHSSHVISDGGFCVDACQHVLDDMTNQPDNSEPPYTMQEAFQQEINDSIRYYSNNPKPKSNLPIITYKYDCDSPYLAPIGTKKIESDYEIHSHDLCCYDKKTKKLSALSESQFAALAFAMSALNNHNPKDYNPLVISYILDARRFMYYKSRINWKFGQCLAAPLAGAIPQEGDTVKDIIMKIRSSIKEQDVNSIFDDVCKLKIFMTPFPSQIVPQVSSIGPIRFKRPVLDVDLRNFHTVLQKKGDHGKANGTIWSFISYSKVNETKNDLHLFSLCSPDNVSLLHDTLLRESICHFLTKIPLDTKYEDALLEIENFQNTIKKDF